MNASDLRKGDIIGHVKTSKSYEYKGVIKCNIDGLWVEMHMYSTYFDKPESFCRLAHDFGEFAVISRNR